MDTSRRFGGGLARGGVPAAVALLMVIVGCMGDIEAEDGAEAVAGAELTAAPSAPAGGPRLVGEDGPSRPLAPSEGDLAGSEQPAESGPEGLESGQAADAAAVWSCVWISTLCGAAHPLSRACQDACGCAIGDCDPSAYEECSDAVYERCQAEKVE